MDYIRVADEKKIKAIYTMIEAEIQKDDDIWTEEFLEELNQRTVDFENGKIKGYTWEEVKARAKEYHTRGKDTGNSRLNFKEKGSQSLVSSQ